MIITVAGLSIDIAERLQGYSFGYSPCHEKFLTSSESIKMQGRSTQPTLHLELEDTPSALPPQLKDLIYRNEIWELWLDEETNLVFTQPKQKPQRWIVIEPTFQNGKIVGNFDARNKKLEYPLQYIDIVIYSNWLSNLGDLILHASGFAFEGQGYCFIGDSGTGKSTLVRDLAIVPNLTVMGEDQIVLRKVGNQHMVYGTPWHETAEMCSPVGVPLRKVFFLDRHAPETVSNLFGFDAVVRILQTAFYPVYRPQVLDGILSNLADMPGNVGFFTLAYNRGTDVLPVILKA